MKIFISWSGEQSRRVAEALRVWIPDVIQFVEPWMSRADIEAGARWGRDIQHQLSETRFGIICLTNANQQAPWILFEAGALAKTIEDTFLCPYLINMNPSEIQAGPLTQFQAKTADMDGTWDLLCAMNSALKDQALDEGRLRRLYDRSWPELKTSLDSGEIEGGVEQKRPVDEMVVEILDTVRGLARNTVKEFTANPLPRPWSDEDRLRFAEYSSEYADFLRRVLTAPTSDTVIETKHGISGEIG
jgi:hypothetical protein